MHKFYPFAKNVIVKSVGEIPFLVVVHCDSTCKQHCRNVVLNENLLVGQGVEYIREIAASIVVVTQVQIEPVHPVAHFQGISLAGRK